MIRTNRLGIKINYQKILDDFVVVKFSTTQKYIPGGALFLDELPSKTNALSVSFSGDKGEKDLFVLFNKQDYYKISLRNEINKITDGDILRFSSYTTVQSLQTVPENTLAQLLINTLSSPKHDSLKINNITGQLYLFHKNNIIKNRKGKTIQIIGLQVKINKKRDLELNVKTFTALSYKEKLTFSKKKPLQKFPQYVLSKSTKALRRKLPEEKIDFENILIMKQFRDKKNNIPFISIASLNDFNASKMGLLMFLMQKIEKRLSDYLEISFEQIRDFKVEKYNRFISKEKEQYINSVCKKLTLNIIDLVQDEFSAERVKELTKEISKYYRFRKIKYNTRTKEDYVNIRLIHNKEYYENYKNEDEHITDNKHIIHNLTFEDFEISRVSIDTLIKEVLIKKDIIDRKISLIDWARYGYVSDWKFGIKDGEMYYFVTIKPDGTLDFARFEPDLFNQNEFHKYTQIFELNKNVEGIIENDEKEINAIVQTNNITIPGFEEIYEKLQKENEYVAIPANDLIESIEDTEINKERKEKYISEIRNNTDSEYIREDILKIIGHRTDRKKLTETLFFKKGILLKAYLRDKTRYEILGSNLDITTFKENEDLYYFVGTKGEGIQNQIPRASIIRKIVAFEDANLFFDQLLPLMNVDFVKNGDLTVKPFPFKYLEEWVKMNS